MRKIPKYGSDEYWKGAQEFEFRTNDGGKLQVYAYSERDAKLKAKNWEKWLVREKRGNERVNLNSIIRKVYK